jgi:hypothetical protein
MTTFSKQVLSGSVDGRAIKLVATGTLGTLVHTGSATPTTLDEVWLYCQNTDTTQRKLTVEWGGVTAPDDLIEITIPAESGLVLIAPGLILKGNASPLSIRAFASLTNVLTIHGYVNRIA